MAFAVEGFALLGKLVRVFTIAVGVGAAETLRDSDIERLENGELTDSVRLWFARFDEEHPLFNQARRRAVCFQICGVDHDALGPGTFTGQRREDAVEHAKAAPANETVYLEIRKEFSTNLGVIRTTEIDSSSNPPTKYKAVGRANSDRSLIEKYVAEHRRPSAYA